MNIGLFFGSFNPIHLGHLIIANVVREQTNLQQVWFVVSPQNPFKKAKSLLNEYDRLRMVELAVEDNYDLRACNIEFSMPKPSFTADTLAYLSERYPTHQFHLILGSDNLTHFHRWKNYQAIIDHHTLYVYARPEASASKINDEISNHPSLHYVEAPLLNISATFIRSLVQQDRSVKYLVADRVADYIRDKKLYLL
ncbi:MAG: nicotinate (nicotinamide) nucleotide adenylyltransferase [Tunicatimonas sp.]